MSGGRPYNRGAMPTYEYACTRCGNRFEVFQRIEDGPLTVCEACGGPLRKVFHPAGIVFKGSGFYATDSRPKPKAETSSFADPYCPEMREVAVRLGREADLSLHERGTVVVVQGPRFSTRSESAFYQAQGWEVINMTQYPETILARELEMCFLNISLITDYDVGVEGTEVEPVSHDQVIQVFQENLGKLRDLLFRIVPELPAERNCPCATALQGARFEPH